MCGLTTKLQSSDIFDFINKYDIVCLTETKIDKCDIIEILMFFVNIGQIYHIENYIFTVYVIVNVFYSFVSSTDPTLRLLNTQELYFVYQ